MMTKVRALYDAIQHIRPIHQYSAKVLADSLARHRITVAMRAVMERVYERGALPVPQIARSLWLPRQAVQRVVNDLAALDLVELTDNPAHRRSKLVSLTDKGRTTFDEIKEEESVPLARIAGGLSAADIDACVRVLSHLTRELRAQASAGEPDHGWSAPGPQPGEEIR